MQKILGLIIMVSFVVSCVFAAENTFTITGPVKSLLYRKKVGGYNTYILFNFFEEQLMSVCYQFDVEHTNRNLYIEDYEKIKRLLIQKYKEPYLDKVIWKNDLYKNDPEHYGFAVSLGYLIYMTSWELPEKDTTILHILSGDNFKINFGTLYEYRSLIKKYNEWKESQTKDEF